MKLKEIVEGVRDSPFLQTPPPKIRKTERMRKKLRQRKRIRRSRGLIRRDDKSYPHGGGMSSRMF